MRLDNSKNMPKVSVILTSFNHDKYIRDSIESVLQQAFIDFELIIWDDTSTDDSWEIIQSYSDSRIKAFRNLQNKGAVFGINKAIDEVARGEYIAIHHSDDIWELDKLAKQVDFLDANQGIGAVFCYAQAIDQSSMPLNNQDKLFSQPNRSRHEWLNHFFLIGNTLCHPSILIRKQCYLACGTYRDMLALMPDVDMWTRLCTQYEIHVMTECLLKFRLLNDKINNNVNHPTLLIRQSNEDYILLQQYRTLLKKETIFKVFPDFITYDRGEDTDPEYVLSRVCLESGDSFLRQLLAIEILFDILNNPVRKQVIENIYGFSSTDFIALTGQYDVFSRQELFNLRVESSEQISNLNHTVDQQSRYIKLIENSFSWKITRPLRNTLGSNSSLRIMSRRVANTIWSMIQPPQEIHECLLSDNVGDTDTQLTPASDDDCPADSVDCPIETVPSSLGDPAQQPQLPPAGDYCHIAPPADDYCFAMPFNYLIEKPAIMPSLAVICHLYYPEMLTEFKDYLSNIPFTFDLFITTDTEEKKKAIANGLLDWNKGTVEVRLAPNQGRDIAPKLITCVDVYDRYEFFLHIHSKKSLHGGEALANWRSYLLETLLGSEKIVASIFEAFNSDPKLGIIAPEHFDLVRRRIGWGSNFDAAKQFSNQFGVTLSLNGKIDFPSGSMFWGRSAAIKPLLDVHLAITDFPPESNQSDATLAHVIERLYFFVCEQAGYRWFKIACPALLKNTERVLLVENKESLIQSIKSTQYDLLTSATQKTKQGFTDVL
jgi:glycosyltransferase involved in cell wall biosynthesis